MSAQICNKCGECYNWSDRDKHKCKIEDIKEHKEWKEQLSAKQLVKELK